MVLLYRSNQAAYLEECKLLGIAEIDCNLIDKVIDDFKSAKIGWLVLVIIIFMISNLSRARRWVLMLNSMGYKPRFSNAFWSVMLGYFANLGIPRSGEFVRAGTFAKNESIAFEKVMGTVVQGRMIDVLSLLFFIILAIVLEYDVFYTYLSENWNLDQKLSFLNGPIIWIIALVLVSIAGLAYFKRQSLFNSKIGVRIKKIVSGFMEGLLSLRKLNKPGEFIFHSILIWSMYYLMNYLCFFSFEPTSHLGLDAGLVSFVMGAIGIVFPSPGGMGSYHAFVQESLVLYGIPKIPDGFSFAIIAHVTIQIICNVSFGIMSLIALPIINRKKA